MKICKVGILGLGLSLSGLCLANPFSNADALFANRGQGASDNEKYESSTVARKAYEAIYNSDSTSEADKLYAFIQMGRIDLFRGGLLDGADLKSRKKALSECVKLSSKAAHDSKRQEHHYFYVACMGGLGKISDFAERVSLAIKLKLEESKALETTKVGDEYIGGFEGGGILRVLAGVYGNPKAKAVHLYNPQQSINFANKALDTVENTYPPFPEAMSGKSYFENFYYLASGQVALGMNEDSLKSVDAALSTLNSTIQAIQELEDAGALPSGREPETLVYKKMMENLKANIETCKPKENWNSCLSDELNK